MLPHVGESIMLRFWRWEDFPEESLLRAISSIKACKHTFWCMVWAAESLVRGAYELGKVVTLARVVTVTDSEFHGQNTDIATMVNRVRTRPGACLARLEEFGIDRCFGCGDSWN